MAYGAAADGGSLTLSAAYETNDSRRAFHERLQTRLAALPGVERVALSANLPFNGFAAGQRFIIDGRPVPRSGTEPSRDVNFVSPEYFDTLGIGLVEGRAFEAADLTREPIPTIINETMARQFWPGESAIGKRIAHPMVMEWQEIVGVVRDVEPRHQPERAEHAVSGLPSVRAGAEPLVRGHHPIGAAARHADRRRSACRGGDRPRSAGRVSRFRRSSRRRA